MARVDDFRVAFKGRQYIPIVQGGMGVDISSADLALALARLGGIGHISDAMSPYVNDKRLGTKYQHTKGEKFRGGLTDSETCSIKWAEEEVYEANRNYVRATMDRKIGSGAIFINVMEKLTMGSPVDTLRARLRGAMDGGVDGITLSAGLHNGSLKLVDDHPRFRDVLFGIIVSSARALKIFLRSAAKVNRLPDYVIVEGPLAGGHLGFGLDWEQYDLKSIVQEVITLLHEEDLNIPVIPAGGVFTGSDAVEFLQSGAAAVQVATRFTISQECGLPPNVKQEYLRASREDVVVNCISPTGYLMRMLRYSPCVTSNIKPNCEALGYILDRDGRCSYREAYKNTPCDDSGKKLPVKDKMCICFHFMKYNCYTCGHYVYRLKDTTVQKPDGTYFLPPAEHIFRDYLYSEEHQIVLPKVEFGVRDGAAASLQPAAC